MSKCSGQCVKVPVECGGWGVSGAVLGAVYVKFNGDVVPGVFGPQDLKPPGGVGRVWYLTTLSRR